MRRLRAALPAPAARLAIALGAVALLVLAVAGSMGVTAASFSDRVTTTAELGAATLPPPEGVTATLAGDLESVSVTWDGAPGDFADAWDVARLDGACSGWSPPTGAGLTSGVTSPHTDGVVEDGETYCYAVRGTFENWTSAYSAVGAATEVYVPAINRLYMHGSNVLQASPGTGQNAFGCLVVLLGACVGTPHEQFTFASTSLFHVPSNVGWHAMIRLQNPLPLAAGTITITVHTWYSSGACGSAPPTGPSLIASGSTPVTVLLGGLTGNYPVTLSPNPSFVEPSTPQTICTRVHSTNPTVLGLLSPYNLANGANTWIEGRFE